MADLFISYTHEDRSYTHEDRPVAAALAAQLNGLGIAISANTPLIVTPGLDPGVHGWLDQWGMVITEALEHLPRRYVRPRIGHCFVDPKAQLLIE